MNRIKTIIANYLLRHLFNSITADDILKYENGQLTVGGKILSNKDKIELINQAEYLSRMYLWELLRKEMKHEANQMIFEKAVNEDDLIFGKAVLFTIDVMEQKINKLKEIK